MLQQAGRVGVGSLGPRPGGGCLPCQLSPPSSTGGGGDSQMQTGLGPWVLLKVTSACWEWNSQARLFQQAP